jgi:hypothetical protein
MTQLQVFTIRAKQQEARLELYNKLDSAQKARDEVAFMKLLQEIRSIDRNICEHGLSIWSPCIACIELTKQIKVS